MELKGRCYWGSFVLCFLNNTIRAKPPALLCFWDKLKCLRVLRQKENWSPDDWLDLKSCADPESTVGTGLLDGYSSAVKTHRAWQDSRAIFQHWFESRAMGGIYMTQEIFSVRNTWIEFPAFQVLMFCARGWALEGNVCYWVQQVEEDDPHILTRFVSGCQPERASRNPATRAGLKGSLSCCCKSKTLPWYILKG